MNHHLTIHYSVFRSHQHFFFTKLVSILVAKSLLHAPRCPSPLRLSLNVTHPHKGLHTESQGAHEYKVYSQANLHKFKRRQTAMESRVRRAWVWRIWGICTDVSHTDTCKRTHTLLPSILTPVRALHRCLHLSLLEKKVLKKISPVLWWLRFSASPLPSSVDYLSPTAFQLPAVASAPLPDFISWHKDFQMEALLFSCPLTTSFLVFSLHSTVSLLSFPSLLSALAPPPPPPPPPPHSSLPSPTFVCL